MIQVQYNKKSIKLNHVWFFNEEEYKNSAFKADVAYIHGIDDLPDYLRNKPFRIEKQNTLIKTYTFDGGGMKRLIKLSNMKSVAMKKKTM